MATVCIGMKWYMRGVRMIYFNGKKLILKTTNGDGKERSSSRG